MTARLDFRCPKCGSRDVVCDASASWDPKYQAWELTSTYDAMHCTECDHDANDGDGWSVELEGAA